MKILVEMMQDIHLQVIELLVTADSPVSDQLSIQLQIAALQVK